MMSMTETNLITRFFFLLMAVTRHPHDVHMIPEKYRWLSKYCLWMSLAVHRTILPPACPLSLIIDQISHFVFHCHNVSPVDDISHRNLLINKLCVESCRPSHDSILSFPGNMRNNVETLQVKHWAGRSGISHPTFRHGFGKQQRKISNLEFVSQCTIS